LERKKAERNCGVDLNFRSRDKSKDDREGRYKIIIKIVEALYPKRLPSRKSCQTTV
jgi:hypothetical protein